MNKNCNRLSVRSDLIAKSLKSWQSCIALLFGMFLSIASFGQTVTIGSGVNTALLPVNTCSNYSYSQQIYTAAQMAQAGTIDKIRFYYAGGGATISTWNNWTVYVGQTSKTSFSTDADWIPVADLTAVFSGTVTPVTGNWFDVSFSTPFVYDGTSNFVVAVDENSAGYSCGASFRTFTNDPNTTIYSANSNNINPASTPLFGSRTATQAQIQVVFLSTTPPNCAISHSPADVTIDAPRNTTLSWADAGGGPTTYDVYFGTATNPAFIGNQTSTTYIPPLLAANTQYFWKVIPKNAIGEATGCLERSFTTGNELAYCTPSSTLNSTFINNFSTTLGITNISNTSGYTTGGYQDNYGGTAVTSYATGAFNYSFTITGGSLGAAIWIDWNANGFFEISERVYVTSSYVNGPFAGTINVPAGTANGDYRMRVLVDNNSSAPSNPCITTGTKTETEDYKITIATEPTCYIPESLTVSNVETTTATLSWTAPLLIPANGYDIYYSTTNTAPLDVSTPTINNHAASPLDVTGLTSSTTYYWWVRSDCGDTSTWVTSGSFTTEQVLATLPYSEDFSGTNSFSFVNGIQVNKWVNGAVAGNPGNAIYISNDAGVTNAYSMGSPSVTQAFRDFNIPAGTTLADLSFDWRAYGETSWDLLTVWLVPTSFTPASGTRITAGSGRIQVGTNFGLKNTWQNYNSSIVNLSAFANSTMRLVFEWTNDGGGGQQTPAAIDNISLTIPTCVAPTALSNSDVTASTATFSWTASSSTPTNGYDVYYSTSNTAPSIATVPNVDNHPASPLNATGLNTSSTYYWWVRSDCGEETSDWIAGGNFTTPCAPETTPTVVQGFDTYQGSAPSPVCWTEASFPLTTNSTLTGTTSLWLLKYSGFANISNTNPGVSINLYGNKNEWIISHPIDLGPVAGVKSLSYDYAVTSYNGTVAQTNLGAHIVRVVVSTDGGATWSDANVIKTYTGVGSYSNTGATEQIVLNYSGIVKIGFLATTLSSTPIDIDFHIDNFSVGNIPSCLAPNELMASNITSSSADLSWNSTGSDFDIKYGAMGFNATTEGTLVENFASGATLSGLTTGTNYQFYVRQDCGNGDLSIWAGPFNFRTAVLGENCLAPIEISTFPFNTSATTCGMGDDYGLQCGSDYGEGEDIVYQLNITTPGAYSINLTDNSEGGYIAWFLKSGSDCANSSSCLTSAVSDGDITANAIYNFGEAGTYYLIIDTWPTPDCSAFTLNIAKYCPTGIWTGTESTDWNTANNWADGLVPEACTEVTVNTINPIEINGNPEVASMTLGEDATLIVNGTLTSGNISVAATGVFTVTANAMILQTPTAVNTGDIIVQRASSNLYRQDYTLWSSPVIGQNLRAFSPATLYNRFSSYDTSISTNGAYVQEINTVADAENKTFANATGYLIRMPNDWTAYDSQNVVPGTSFLGVFKGVLNNGTITKSLSLANNKLNLVGNPYPSPISISALFTGNLGINQSIYFWRKRNDQLISGYVSYTPGMGMSNGMEMDDTIQSGQGFFVTSNVATTLTFENSMRTSTQATPFLKSGTETAELHRFWLSLSNSTGLVGQTLIGYATGATQGVDNGYDALYFNDSAVALTSIIDNNEYIIQGRSVPFVDSDSVPLGFKSDVAGSFTIELSNFDGLFAENQAIYLKDNVTGTSHNLKVGAYTFTTPIGIFNDRFEVQYTNSALGTNNPEFPANTILVGVKNQVISINAGTMVMEKVELIDVAGRVICTQEGVNATATTLENVVSANQMLIVRISTVANGVVTQKIIF